ncbi:F-box protein [Aspergillus fijiensis CBS 313.89]|uniref:F-box domain-containing protein n=1 Tax=Aspergillus fijiensis CBS 313.89 TaxID=1448319 RepID=A0A8G1RMR4_9EURO|nr:uncharacterized protein BO72DRAFT_513630 [Aspergillus fijiensis CBS 313.89]RAK75297.1 hypothetical protein BO72DRAFT_513630 [Aspergillus fijiensis CBS 313.89]
MKSFFVVIRRLWGALFQRQRQRCRFFLIPELLEMILLHFNMRELLLSSRVCRHWYNVIQQSSRIQRALFFRPSLPRAAIGEPGLKNPLVRDQIWDEFFVRVLDSRRRPGNERHHLPKMRSRKREEAYLRPEASWRRMLLHQPPTSFIRFLDPDWCWSPAAERGAITLGDLERLIDAGAIVPSARPFVCCPEVIRQPVRWREAYGWLSEGDSYRRAFVDRYLECYDLVIYVDDETNWHWQRTSTPTPFTEWVMSAGLKLRKLETPAEALINGKEGDEVYRELALLRGF